MQTTPSTLSSSPTASILFEWQLIVLSLTLTGIGIVLILSATAPMGAAGKAFVVRQLMWVSIGIVFTACFLFYDYHVLERWGLWLYVMVILMLILVWSVGKVTAGSRRWIDLGLMRFQPSEFAKLAVVILFARYFQDKVGEGGLRFADLVRPILLLTVPVILVLIQPDLGTAAVTFLVALSMILFVGINRKTSLWLLGSVAVLAPVAFWLGQYVLLDYQKKRILTFFNPEYDPAGAGYHIIQSQIAIGSGGLFGKDFSKEPRTNSCFCPSNTLTSFFLSWPRSGVLSGVLQ
ncbi:MAG: rod shape determining protein RodA [Thermodesulfobacteriota bacterium]|nr:rod shape determining protein RodA [Thermodesulfobacteriota bacterium]